MGEFNNSLIKTQRQISIQVLLGFALAIIIGATILSIPYMTQKGEISFIDATFTATSAVCVTGLIVQDTPTYFTDAGKAVILIFIQLGGLGIMTITSIFGLILGRRIHFRDKFYIETTFGSKRNLNPARFFALIAITTFIFEFIGMIALALRFYLKYNFPARSSFTFGLFHSISAFNNAGFSLFSNSFENFIGDIVINLTIMFLIVFGGIGFSVIGEILTIKKIKKFSLHSKLVLVTTLCLILFGALTFFFMEFKNLNSIGEKPLGVKVLASFFQSITPRTAGLHTINMSKLNYPTLFFLALLMFIGASPGGTGGGIKTTTFTSVIIGALSTLRGRKNIIIFKRKISENTIKRALIITLAAIVLIITATILIMFLEKCTLLAALFEVISAFGTVGLSTGITHSLTTASKVILILCMYIGRVGISVLSIAVAFRSIDERIDRPEEPINIG